ncbi:MAG TPA: hypothetical protein VF121_14545 [Thermoanaerobaculia bacterium]|nr:hypothetical protein [Thermoanaerobaculia bacterium]
MAVAVRFRSLVVALAAVLTALATAVPAHAGKNRFTPFGPDGGVLYALAVDPRDDEVLYASSGRGLVKSLDGGESWRLSAVGAEGYFINALAVDPSEPDRVYAVGTLGGDYSVFRSDDAGAHWQRVARGDGFLSAEEVTVLPDGTVLVGSSQILWRSTDHGATWLPAFATAGSADQFHSLAWSPLAPRTVYAATLFYRLKSEDAGATWARLQEVPGEFQPSINALAVAPGDPLRVYETGDGAIPGLLTYRSRDGGATWERLLRFGGHRLLVDPRDPDIVYGANLHGLFVSRDGGETWHKARRGVPPLDIDETDWYDVFDFAAGPRGTIYAATGQGLLRSDDAGYHWRRPAGRGLRSNPVTFLRLDPHDPEHWLVRSFDDFYATEDGGRSFAPTAEALRGRQLVILELDPFTPGRVLAIVWGRQELARFELLESRDGGATWKRIGPPAPSEAVDLVFVSRRVLLTAAGGTIWRSTNDGGRWRPVLTATCACDGAVRFRHLVADPARPATFYALADVVVPHGADPPRIYRSLDAGRHWSLWATGYRALAPDPHDPRVVYVAQNRTIARTRNGGRSFETLGTLPGDAVRELQVDENRPDVLYATTFASGVWRSLDGGRTWELLPGLPNGGLVGIQEFAQDRSRPGRLLAAPASGGLWRGDFD